LGITDRSCNNFGAHQDRRKLTRTRIFRALARRQHRTDMRTKSHLHPSDLQGIARLAVDATLGVTGIVEDMHRNIAGGSPPIGAAPTGATRGLTGLVYRGVRGVTRLTGAAIDAAMTPLLALFAALASSPQRNAVLAAMNGVMGDYLEESANPLALRMEFKAQGQTLTLERDALAAALPHPSGHLLLMIHGLCMNGEGWRRQGHDHGAVLAHELGASAIYLSYNTGLHISTNGQRLAALLEKLVSVWPVEPRTITVVAHSMGGLVARSALHAAKRKRHRWPARLKQLVFLGTPHHGSPVERGGNAVDALLAISPYVAPFARLGQIRSAGITDLRHGNLVDSDWLDADRFARKVRRPAPLPLPIGPTCFAIAATTGKSVGDTKDRLIGDGLVPVASALGQHRIAARSLGIPASRQRIVTRTNHMDLLCSQTACAQLVRWLRPD
jgi:pimeloyl-ACP methyl ester carboxylesterase